MLVILCGIGFYIFLVFFLSRLIVPHYGFTKSKIPEKIPQEWEEVIEDLKKTAHSQEEYLKNAYGYISTHYKGGRFKTVLRFKLLFQDPFSHKDGYIQCNIQNYLLRVLLVKSGWFEEKDIQVKVTILNFFTHQYLQVKVGGEWIDVDPHESYKGVPLGKHSQWFG